MSLVQWGHLTASIATSLLQKGQTLVVGSAGASSSFFLPISDTLLIVLTKRKITNAMIRKLMIAVTKAP